MGESSRLTVKVNVQDSSRSSQLASLDREGAPSPGPSSYQQASPLATLVRKASSRRAHEHFDTLHPHTPPRKGQPEYPSPTSPTSPLLHAQFRVSTSTAATYDDRNSYLVDGDRSTGVWGDEPESVGGEADRSRPISQGSTYSQKTTRVQSMASVYSNADEDPQARQSLMWQPAGYPEDSRATYTAGRHPILQPQMQAPPSPAVPSVLVSNAVPSPVASTTSFPAGRTPSQLTPGHRIANFSRPVPPVIDGTEQRKREVLMRNARALSPFSRSPKHESASPSIVPSIRVEDAEPTYSGSLSAPPQQTVFGSDMYPNGMPRAASPSSNSLYSSYSYYPYDGNIDMPPSPNSPHLAQGHGNPPNKASPSPTPSNSARTQESYELSSPGALSNPRTPQDFLQLGISHHIANRLQESAQCFEQSATLNGGCGVGMLMWGLALRHGWGVAQSEEKGFKWLRRAAEGAVTDLESAKAGMDTTAIKSELVIGIYEVGQSFFRGWGVEKDKKMGVNYFRVAARLGDPDAQQSLAFALEHGKGCKKDRKEAAKWYREAVKQGASDIGLTWIYKEKFQ